MEHFTLPLLGYFVRQGARYLDPLLGFNEKGREVARPFQLEHSAVSGSLRRELNRRLRDQKIERAVWAHLESFRTDGEGAPLVEYLSGGGANTLHLFYWVEMTMFGAPVDYFSQKVVTSLAHAGWGDMAEAKKVGDTEEIRHPVALAMYYALRHLALTAVQVPQIGKFDMKGMGEAGITAFKTLVDWMRSHPEARSDKFYTDLTDLLVRTRAAAADDRTAWDRAVRDDPELAGAGHKIMMMHNNTTARDGEELAHTRPGDFPSVFSKAAPELVELYRAESEAEVRSFFGGNN